MSYDQQADYSTWIRVATSDYYLKWSSGIQHSYRDNLLYQAESFGRVELSTLKNYIAVCREHDWCNEAEYLTTLLK